MLSQQLQRWRISEPKLCALLDKWSRKAGKADGIWGGGRSLSSILQNKNTEKLLELEIVWLAILWRDMISSMIKEAVAGTYVGGGQWWRGNIPFF